MCILAIFGDENTPQLGESFEMGSKIVSASAENFNADRGKILICLAHRSANREPLNRVPCARTVHRTDSGYLPDFLCVKGFRALRSAAGALPLDPASLL